MLNLWLISQPINVMKIKNKFMVIGKMTLWEDTTLTAQAKDVQNLITSAYRNSFFNTDKFRKDHNTFNHLLEQEML